MRQIRLVPAAVALLVSLIALPAYAVNLADDGVGEVAIAPYYTVRDNWQTLFTLVNTQRQPLLVKVRFREGRNSRVVLDFLVGLAGFDTFVGAVREGPDGPVFVGADSPDEHGAITCTVPSDIVLNRQLETLVNLEAGGVADLNGLVVNNVRLGEDAILLGNVLNNVFEDDVRNTEGVPLLMEGFSGRDDSYPGQDVAATNSDGGPATVDRMREGYVEFIVLGYAQLPDNLLEFPVTVPARPIPTPLNQTLNDLTSTITDDIVSDSVNDIVSDVSEVPLATINVATAIEHHHCALLDYAFYDYENPLTPAVDPDDIDSSLLENLVGDLVGSLDELLNGTPALQFRPSFVLESARQFGEPINALKVNYSMVNPVRGVEASGAATTWANFYNPEPRPGVVDETVTPREAAEDQVRVTPRQNEQCLITRGDERVDPPATEGVVPGLLNTVGGLLFCPDGSLNLLGLEDCQALPVDWKPSGPGSENSCLNLVTAQRPLGNRPPPLLTVLTGTEELGALQVSLLGENGANTFAFLEPSLNDAWPRQANWFDDERNITQSITPRRTTGLAAPEDTRGVDAFSFTIQRQSIINEFSSNPAQGIETNWIVTMPTRSFYVDDGLDLDDASTPDVDESLAGRYTALLQEPTPPGVDLPADAQNFRFGRPEAFLRSGGAGTLPDPLPYAPFASEFGQTAVGDPASAGACNDVSVALYDRAEQTDAPDNTGGVVDSPAPPVTFDRLQLCREVSVVTFDGGTSMLDPVAPVNVDYDLDSLSGNRSGWMFMNLDDAQAASTSLGGGLAGVGMRPSAPPLALRYGGLPVIGFMLKQRTFGSVTRNFASSTDHSYQRDREVEDQAAP